MNCKLERQVESPDKGWSWVIVFAAFIVSYVTAGTYRASGTMLVAFMDEFKLSREVASRPLFFRTAVMDLVGIIAGPLGQWFGLRTTTIAGGLISAAGMSICYFTNSIHVITASYGAISGFGFGLAYTIMPAVVNQYFVNYRVIATGISNTGASLGFFLFPIMYKYFIFTYQLNGCFLLTGGIILQVVIAGALMRNPPWLKRVRNAPKSVTNDNGNLRLNTSVLRSFKTVLTCPMFYAVCFTNLIVFLVEDIFFTINVDFFHDNAIDDKYIRHMSLIFAICDITGRLGFGWITDQKFLQRSQFIMVCLAINAAIFFSFPFAKNYVAITFLNSIYGINLGCTVVTIYVLPVDYLEPEVYSVAYGCFAFSNGLMELSFSRLIGYFRDYLGSYSTIYFIMGTLSGLSSLMWLLQGYLSKRGKTPTDDQDDQR